MYLKYISKKQLKSVFSATILLIVGLWSCNSGESPIAYSVTINDVSDSNLPALQSFAHGIKGPDWLLFAGRTNKPASGFSGGLHNLNANYADSSFIPFSFNQNIFVYNIESRQLWQKPVKWVIDTIHTLTGVKLNKSIFISTNPLDTQDGDYLYVLGGYGPNPDTSNYGTYNQIAKINVPAMISLIKGNFDSSSLPELIHVGKDSTNTLINTGGELFKIGDTLYMAGGQNFGNSVSPQGGQKYISAVYPFTVSETGNTGLKVNVLAPISDVANPQNPVSADNSIFRRRDAPIVPAVYYINGSFVQGITFYAGVFKNTPDTALQAWNDAIYVHPGAKVNNMLYTYDSLYNQSNYNVYSCADLEAYDPFTNTLHTFLIGGIGDGKISSGSTLSSFTDKAVHVTLNMESLTSSYALIDSVFPAAPNHYYGAESEFILNRIGTRATDPVFYKAPSSKETEVVDISKSFTDDKDRVLIGYVYGGIESFQKDPGTYGKGNSGASNKLWEVWLNVKWK